MMQEVRKNVLAKGWRTGDNTFGDYIALLHSEVSEALEAFRDHGDFQQHFVPVPDSDPPVMKPTGVDNELADVLIRLLDMCDLYGIDLFRAYQEKMAYNRTRPYQHGGRTLNRGLINHDEPKSTRPAVLALLEFSEKSERGRAKLEQLSIQWPALAAALGKLFIERRQKPPVSLRRALQVETAPEDKL
jgi:NTP pyrophosphatase (non-canonical NTP hydrolase)